MEPSVAFSNQRRDDGHKLEYKEFHLSLREKNMVVKHWHRLQILHSWRYSKSN